MAGTITVSESILFWAFRYCLGRRTGAAVDCVDNILICWDKLPANTKHTMQEEIITALADDTAGMHMDKQQWLRVAERYNREFSYDR